MLFNSRDVGSVEMNGRHLERNQSQMPPVRFLGTLDSERSVFLDQHNKHLRSWEFYNANALETHQV